MALTDKLSAIGDAIRRKTGKTDKLTLDNMVSEIDSIQSGGGSAPSITVRDFLSETLTEYVDNETTEINRLWVFSSYKTLKKVSIPNLKAINNFTFNGSGVLELDFPLLEKVNGLHNFKSCSDLKRCIIPKAVMSSGVQFQNDYDLVEVDISSMPQVPGYGFTGCFAIPKINLPKVSKIESFNWAPTFQDCYKLTALILRNPSIVALTDATNLFRNCPIQAGGYKGLEGYIYVPKALIEQYKTTTNWTVYADRFRAIEDYPDICGGAQ